MPVTGAVTNRDICTDALRKLGVAAEGEVLDAEMTQTSRRALERMLKAWQNRGMNLWTVTGASVTATTSASYTLDPVRPFHIHGVRFKRNGIETPMQEMTRTEYDSLPQKASAGTPTSYYYDKQREAAVLYVWPVPASVTSETLEITYTRETEDISLDDAPDFPREFEDAVVYGLAARLADDYPVDNANGVIARAEEELRLAEQFDREGSVYFVGYE